MSNSELFNKRNPRSLIGEHDLMESRIERLERENQMLREELMFARTGYRIKIHSRTIGVDDI